MTDGAQAPEPNPSAAGAKRPGAAERLLSGLSALAARAAGARPSLSGFRSLGSLQARRAPRPNLAVDPSLAASGFRPGDALAYDLLGSCLPHAAYDEADRLFFLEGAEPGEWEGIGFVVGIVPQTGVTEEMKASLLAMTQGILPVKSTLAVTILASPIVDRRIAAWLEPRAEGIARIPDASVRAMAMKAAVSRARRFLAAAGEPVLAQAPLPVRDFRAWAAAVYATPKPFDPEVRQAALDARQSIVSVLSQNHLFERVWGLQDFIDAAGEMLNPQKVRAGEFFPRAANPLAEPRHQLLARDTEVLVKKRGIRFSGGVAQASPASGRRSGAAASASSVATVTAVAASVEAYHQRLSLASTSLLLGEPGRSGAQIPCPFALTMALQIPDALKEKAAMEMKRARARQMAGTPIGALTPYYQEMHKEYQLALGSYAGDGGIARMMHQMVLFAPAGREAECIRAAQSVARKAGMDLQPNTAMHAQGLLAALPLGATPGLMDDCRQMQRLPLRTLGAAVHGMPIMAEYKGTGRRAGEKRLTPLLMLLGRKGQVELVDSYANPNGSYSMTIVGKPGSGKSVVMNELAFSVFSMGGRVWIIDVGRSYEKLARLLGGAFIELSDDDVWDMNPFRFALPDLPGAAGGAGGPSPAAALQADAGERIEMIAGIIAELMTAEGLSPVAQSILRQAVGEAAGRALLERRAATMADLKAALERFAPERREALDMLVLLEPYLPGGALGKWFDGTGRPIDLSNRFMVLELGGLSAFRELRAGILMTVISFIERAMAKESRAVPKMVLIDEAWDLMGAGRAGKFIEAGYRRARKLNGAFVTATQSAADYWMSETAQAAWRCADARIFLRQDADVLESLMAEKKMKDDPWLREAVASLTTVAQAYSEMVVKVGDDPAAIGRLVLDPYSSVVYSTLPAETAAVDAWRRRGFSVDRAVAEVAAGRLEPGLDDWPEDPPGEAADKRPHRAAASF